MDTVSLTDHLQAKKFYDARFQQGYMEEWDEGKKKKVRIILQELNLPKTGSALDFGCGNGVFTNIIKEVYPGWTVYGFDISETAVKNATKAFPQCNFFYKEAENKYHYHFDFLFSHHVIEHVQDLAHTFALMNRFLKPDSLQLHILPCGNADSFEFRIASLKQDGIEKEKGNRFFFEEPGHLRRLTSQEFEKEEQKIGFKLISSYFTNQHYGAINWITKSSPRFIRKLTALNTATDALARKELKKLRNYLLALTLLQFPYSKYWLIKGKWNKKISDYLKLSFLFIPAMVAKPFYIYMDKKSETEWKTCRNHPNGSEMYLLFERKSKADR